MVKAKLAPKAGAVRRRLPGFIGLLMRSAPIPKYPLRAGNLARGRAPRQVDRRLSRPRQPVLLPGKASAAMPHDPIQHAPAGARAAGTANPLLVEVTRGGMVESRHRAAIAVVDAQ